MKLHPESLLAELAEAGARLRRLSTDHILDVLARLAARACDPDDRIRREFMKALPKATGLSEPVVARGVDAVFRPMTVEGLRGWLRSEGLTPRDLDCWNDGVRIIGPRTTFVCAAGVIPYPTVMCLAAGLVARSGVLIKIPQSDSMLAPLLVHALREVSPEVGAAVAAASWTGGDTTVEGPILSRVDAVVAFGSDETVADLRRRTPIRTRFIAHSHRFSIGLVTAGADVQAAARGAATDVCLFDLLGCLSPAVFFVEGDADAFADALSRELETQTRELPPGERTPADRAAIRRAREQAEFEELGGRGVRLRASADGRWTVIRHERPPSPLALSPRVVHVAGIDRVEQIAEVLGSAARSLSTVGVAGADSLELCDFLVNLGARRICPLGTMQTPPLAWHHDGRFHLRDLLEWVDWER